MKCKYEYKVYEYRRTYAFVVWEISNPLMITFAFFERTKANRQMKNQNERKAVERKERRQQLKLKELLKAFNCIKLLSVVLLYIRWWLGNYIILNEII